MNLQHVLDEEPALKSIEAESPAVADGLTASQEHDSEHVRGLAAIIEKEERRRFNLVLLGAGALLLIAILLAYFSASSMDSSRNLQAFERMLAFGAFSALLGPIILALILTVPSRKLRSTITEFSRLSAKGDINALFQLRRSIKGPTVNKEVHAALTRALLGVRASDAGKITSASYVTMYYILGSLADLNRTVRSDSSLEFYLALIRAFEQVGDERAVKPLERIAQSKGRSEAKRKLQKAAEEALPAIRERIRANSAPNTLLRAAESASQEDLLRPAAGSSGSGAATLLHPISHFSNSPGCQPP